MRRRAKRSSPAGRTLLSERSPLRDAPFLGDGGKYERIAELPIFSSNQPAVAVAPFPAEPVRTRRIDGLVGYGADCTNLALRVVQDEVSRARVLERSPERATRAILSGLRRPQHTEVSG